MEESKIKCLVEKLTSKETDAIIRIQTTVLKAMHDFMYKKRVLQLMPVILSPITDPLSHDVYDGAIKCYDQTLQLTKSMILHKQISLLSKDRVAIYIVSPNIRLEIESKGKTGRHLFEFSQVDYELKDMTMREAMDFTEEMFVHVIGFVKSDCWKELEILGRELAVPKRPFKIYDSATAKEKLGPDFETILSKREEQIFWLINHDREFYDKEDPKNPGSFLNYDIIYPEGFGEGLSGAEREYEYDRIIYRMKRNGTNPESFKPYLKLVKMGLIPKTAGAGFGVERLVRYLCGKGRIEDVVCFPRIPGEKVFV